MLTGGTCTEVGEKKVLLGLKVQDGETGGLRIREGAWQQLSEAGKTAQGH